MQFTEKLWMSKEEQWQSYEPQFQELHWNSKAKKGCGYALHREAMDTRGDDTAKPGYARLRYAMKSKAAAMLGKARHRRSVDGTGSGTAKKRCDVQRR